MARLRALDLSGRIHLPDLDPAVDQVRAVAGQLHGLDVVLGLDHEVAAHDFLGLAVRTVHHPASLPDSASRPAQARYFSMILCISSGDRFRYSSLGVSCKINMNLAIASLLSLEPSKFPPPL